MVCKCPKCDGALEYNPAYDKMECPYCGSNFTTAEVMSTQNMQDHVVKMEPVSSAGATGGGWESNPYAQQAQTTGNESMASGENAQNTMECNIYTCTACGAELAVNGV